MRQIVSNLLHNALKYSAAPQPVLLALSEEDDQVVLVVSDTGIGIPPEDMKQLFEPFHRATNVGTISGTGLGLSITQQAIALHSGSIHVQSEPGQGTQVRAALPILATKEPSDGTNHHH
ncbi:MAG: sensor histidine kinase [Anaerolineae bacterium]|nr:sensor histidine kinase [Anaerolineae bacterium]